MVRAGECWNITADAAGQDASKCRLAQMLGSPSCAAAGMQRDLLHRHHASFIVGLWPARASSPRAHEGFMLWKLTPEQLDRFLLVAAAILTVVFAIVALALAFLAF